MSDYPKEIISKLKYRSKIYVRTLDDIISCCGIPMGAITQNLGAIHDDYFYFCLAKACKELRSARILYDNKQFEGSLVVLRSVYESYLAISCMMDTDVNFVHERLVKHPAKVHTLLQKSTHKLDSKIHDELYSYLCGFAHVNMGTYKHYLDDSNGFPEFTTESNLSEFPIALFFNNYLGNLLLAEAIRFEDLDPPQHDAIGRQIIGGTGILMEYIDEIKRDYENNFYEYIRKRSIQALHDFRDESYKTLSKKYRTKADQILSKYSAS